MWAIVVHIGKDGRAELCFLNDWGSWAHRRAFKNPFDDLHIKKYYMFKSRD